MPRGAWGGHFDVEKLFGCVYVGGLLGLFLDAETREKLV